MRKISCIVATIVQNRKVFFVAIMMGNYIFRKKFVKNFKIALSSRVFCRPMGSEREPLNQDEEEKKEPQDGFFTDAEIRIIARIASSRSASEYVGNCCEVRQQVRMELQSNFFRILPFDFRGEIFACAVLQKIIAAHEFGPLINRHDSFSVKQIIIRNWMKQLFPLSHKRIISEIEEIWKEKKEKDTPK